MIIHILKGSAYVPDYKASQRLTIEQIHPEQWVTEERVRAVVKRRFYETAPSSVVEKWLHVGRPR